MLKKVNFFWLLVAFIAQLLTYFFTAIIYRVLLKAFEVKKLPVVKELYKASVISLFFNQTIPSAGISGNTFLYSFFEKKNIAVSTIISLILTELLSFYVVFETIILLFLVLSFGLRLPVVLHTVFFAGFLVYFVFGLAVVLVGRKRSFDLFQRKLGKVKLIKKFFEKVNNDLDKRQVGDRPLPVLNFKKKRRSITSALLFQLLVVAADAFTIFALFQGLGIDVPFSFVALVLIGSKIISVLPFSPGALILYESSMTYLFVSLGVPLGTSVIVTLVYRLLSFWLPIPAGLVLYRQWSKG